MIQSIHQFLDNRPPPSRTWHYERRVRIALEILLLIACAIPAISGWRSGVAQVLIAALRLRQAWRGHEGKSIKGRAKEQGHALTNLPPEKQKILDDIEADEAFMSWVWPGLFAAIAAAESKMITWALILGVLTSWIRYAFDTKILPAWRKTRLAWKDEHGCA